MKRAIIVALLSVAAVVIVVFLRTRADQGGTDRGAEGRPLAVGPEPLRRILFIGVDGADWEFIDPLIAKGRLPHFAELVRGGTTGTLQSLEPMLSPLLWTTMATGKLPEEHGILSFTQYDPRTGSKVPVGRSDRRVDAFWNMLSDYGRTVDVVGWLATYPAESIRGVMVTDRVGYLAYAGSGDADGILAGKVSPANRSGEIAGKLVKAQAVQYDRFKRFVRVDERTFLEARSLAFDPRNPTNNMIMLYASTLSYRNIARHLLRVDQPDFLAVYFELVDATSHLFMHYAPPRRPDVDAVLYEQFKDAVEEAYAVQDEIVGELMAQADDNTVIILASDHGFRSGPSRPKWSPEIWAGKAAFWHRLEGVVCLYGNGIRQGHRLTGATILDVAPTILALQRLPQPADFSGKILVEAFAESLAVRLNRAAVTTLQRQRPAVAVSADDPTAQDALKKLEALGYITPENADAHNNLGRRYQQQGQFEKAIGEFEKALALRPDFSSALNNLGTCYLKLGQHAKAGEAFRRALTLKPDNVYAMNNLAILYLEGGDLTRARELAEQAVTVDPNYANGHLTLGSIYGAMNAFEKAEQQFRKVLEIDPSNQTARGNLEKIRVAPGVSP